jgi:hypothetical protein
VRARRTAYIVIFVVACLVAGLLYYLQVPRASVVRATASTILDTLGPEYV